MADYTITAASVSQGANAVLEDYIAGEDLTANQPVYIDSADNNEAKRADANDTAAKAVVRGLTLHGALSGQPVRIQRGGKINFGNNGTVGDIVILSDAVGLMCPSADLASGHYLSIIGAFVATGVVQINIFNTGVQKP